jgi:redox-regulated HSP33 family molecular chaperone
VYSGLQAASGDAQQPTSSVDSGDVLLAGLSATRDISLKVVSCREVVQQLVMRNDLSETAGQTLGEAVVCALMSGTGLKDKETLQLNFVGNCGLGNVCVITDGELQVRGYVGQRGFDMGRNVGMSDILGEGQVQTVRMHPDYKHPYNGISTLRDCSIALNMALHLQESGQSKAVVLTDVFVEGGLVRHALGTSQYKPLLYLLPYYICLTHFPRHLHL